MPELNVSHTSIPDAMGSSDQPADAINRSKDGKNAVFPRPPDGENDCSITAASTSRGAALKPPKPPMRGLKSGNDISPATTACGGDIPWASLQGHPLRSSGTAKSEKAQEEQSEENLTRTLPTSGAPPPPSVLSGCSVATVRNSPVEGNRVDTQTDNDVNNSGYDSNSKPEDITRPAKVHMKNISHPQAQNRLECFDIQNRVPRTDIPEVESSHDQGSCRNPVSQQSSTSQGPQESATSQSICSTFTGAELGDSSHTVLKTTTDFSPTTSQEKGQASIDVSKYRRSKIAGSGISTDRSDDQVSITSKKSLPGKNDEVTFMSEYEKYVSEGHGLGMTKLKSISPKSLMGYPALNDHYIKEALLRGNLPHNKEKHIRLERDNPVSESNYVPAHEMTTAPTATTLKEMVQRRLVTNPGKPGGLDDSSENATAISLLKGRYMKESAVDSNSPGGFAHVLGLIPVSSLSHPSIRDAFPNFIAPVQYSTAINIGSISQHIRRSEFWGKQAKHHTGTYDTTHSSTPVTVLDMSTDASAPSVQTDMKGRGRGRGRGSRTRGGGRRARGVRRIGANKPHISTVSKGKDEDYGGMDSLDPLQIDDACTQLIKRGGRGTRIRGGGRRNVRDRGRGRGSISQGTNPVVDPTGSKVNEGVALDFSKSQEIDQGKTKPVRRRKQKRGGLSSETPHAYVDLTEGGLDSAEKHTLNRQESNSPFAFRNDGPQNITSYREVVQSNQDGPSSSSVHADMHNTTKRLTSHSTIKSLINQPTLQPIPPCSREYDAARTPPPSILPDRRRENNVNGQPVVTHMNQYHRLQQMHGSPTVINHPLPQTTAQNVALAYPSRTPTLANVLTPDGGQQEASKPTSAQLQTHSTPDLANVLSNKRPAFSLLPARAIPKLVQFLNDRKVGESTVSVSDPHQTNVIDLTADTGTSVATTDRVMSPSRPIVRGLQQPMRRRSCPDLHLSIPVPVCQMSKDTTGTATEASLKENENISSLQDPVLLPKDMFCPTLAHPTEVRQQQAQSSAAIQSPTVVSLLNSRPVRSSSVNTPIRNVSPAHQVLRKETLRLTRMLTPPAAHTQRCPTDILIEPAPPDISAIHMEMIHQSNEADPPRASSSKAGQTKSASTARYSAESTSVLTQSHIQGVELPASDNGVLCPHGHKCTCSRSNASSPDVQILKGPLPSTSDSIEHHSHTKSKAVENDQMQASNLTVQRKNSTHSKPASIPNVPMLPIPKEKCMTTCAHQFFGSSTHGMGFPHCAHTSACPKVTLQQKCCQHLSGVPPPAHSKIPIEILETTPLDLTALPPKIIEEGLDLTLKDNEIPGPSSEKQQIGPHADGLCGTKSPVSSASIPSFQPVNYSKTSQGIGNTNYSRDTSADTGASNEMSASELLSNDTVIQTPIDTRQHLTDGVKPQLHYSDHLERPTTVEQSGQQSETVTSQKKLDNLLIKQRESENTREECPDMMTKIQPTYNLMDKSTIVQERKPDRRKQKKSTKVNINTIGMNLVKLAEREQQLKVGKVGKKVSRKPKKQKPETGVISSLVSLVETTQQNSLSPADITNSSTDLANSLTDITTERITATSNTTDHGTETESGPDTLAGKRSPGRPMGSLNKKRKKRNAAVNAKIVGPNHSPIPKRKNSKKSVSLHLDTNAGSEEPPQTSRPKRAASTLGGYTKECTCTVCINYDMPKRRRSKESASGNSTPSTPSTPSVQHVEPLMSTNRENESSTSMSTDPLDGSKEVSSEMNFDKVNKQSPVAQTVLNDSTSLATVHNYESKDTLTKHSPEVVDSTPISKVVADDRETVSLKSLAIGPKDINEDMSPKAQDIVPILPALVDTEIESSISLTAMTHKEAQPEGTIEEEASAVPSQALDTVSSDKAEMHSTEAQMEIKEMAGSSDQIEDVSKENTETKDMSLCKIDIQQESLDEADGSTELGLVISHVVGGFTEGPTNDEEPTVNEEFNEQHRNEISDSGHFSLSDNEYTLKLPESETDSFVTNLGCPEETDEKILGTVTVKPDKTEKPNEKETCQDSINIKTEVNNDQITEELTERSESNQNAVNSNSDTDSDLPSFYSYLSAGNHISVNSKETVSSDMQIERQMTPEECDVGTTTLKHLKRRTKGKGRKKHLTRRKKTSTTNKMVPPPIIYEDIDELPDIKHHIVIQDYSTTEKEAIPGNEELIDLEKGNKQVPVFPDIAIKQEPVDDTSIYFPLIKQCSIVLQKIQPADPQLQKLNSKQSQSRKRKPSSLPKASDKPKYRRTSKRAAKVALEIADNGKESTEAGSLYAMQTTDQIIKSEPSYDEASTSAYSDGGNSALESEDDECNLKVLQKNVVTSNEPHQASSNLTLPENSTVVDQSHSKDEQASHEPAPLSDQCYLQPKGETGSASVEDNQDTVSDACDAVNDADANLLSTENAEADSSTIMSYQQRCTSDQQDYALDHQTHTSEEQENRLDQTGNVAQQKDGTSEKEKDQLINQESTEVFEAVSANREEAGSAPLNAQTKECKFDEKEQPSATIVNSSEVQSTEKVNLPDSCNSINVCKNSLLDQHEIQEGSVTESEYSGHEHLTTNLLAACNDTIDPKTTHEQQSFANVMDCVSEQGETVTNLSSEPQAQTQNSNSPQSRKQKPSILPNVSDQQQNCRSGKSAVKGVLEIADNANSPEADSLCVMKTTDQVIKPNPPCNEIVDDSCSSMNVTKSSAVFPDATANRVQEQTVTESVCSTHENQTAKISSKKAARKRSGGKQKAPMSEGLESESGCENIINNQNDTIEEEAVTQLESSGYEHLITDSQAAGHNAVSPPKEAEKPGQTSNQGEPASQELPTGSRGTEPTSEEQTATNILESDPANNSVGTIKSKVTPPKKGTKTAAKKRSAAKQRILKPTGLESESAGENLIKNQDDTIQAEAVTELEYSGREPPITDIVAAGHNAVRPLEEAGEQGQTSNQVKPASEELPTDSTSTDSTSEEQTVTNILESETASKVVETVINKVSPPKKTKTGARKRSAGKGKLLKHTGFESESVCEKPIKNQADTMDRIQEETVTEFGCSGPEQPTTDIPADDVNPLEEAGEPGQISNLVEPSSEALHTGSSMTESSSREQSITDVLESVCKSQKKVTNQPESLSQKSQPIRDLLAASSKGDKTVNKKAASAIKGTKTYAKNRSGGKRKILKAKGLASEELIENRDDTANIIQEKTVIELDCSLLEHPTTDTLPASHDAVNLIEEAGVQGQSANQVEPASEELSTGLSITSTNEKQTVTNVLASGLEEQTKFPNTPKSSSKKGVQSVKKKAAPANKGTKTAAKKRSGGKQKKPVPQRPESESICDKPIENSDDMNTKNQDHAVVESVGSEHEHPTTYLLVKPAKKGNKTAAKKQSCVKQKKPTPKGLKSESAYETPIKSLNNKKTKNQEQTVTASLGSEHEHLTIYVPVTPANQGIKAAAKKRSGGKQKKPTPKGLKSESVCETPITSLDNTKTKNQEQTVTASVDSEHEHLTTYVSVTPANQGTKAAAKKRSGGKQKMPMPKGLTSESVYENPIKSLDNPKTKNQEQTVIASVDSEHEHPSTYLLVTPAKKGTKTAAKKRSGGKQKTITPKGLESESVGKKSIKNLDDTKTKISERAVTELECFDHEQGTTPLVPAGHYDVNPLEEVEEQGQTSNQVEPASAELHTGSSVLESGCEPQLKVTNPPIRKLLETGTKGFKTYKVTKKTARKLFGEKRKMLTLGGLESDKVRDKLIKKQKFEDMSMESKKKNKSEAVKRCYVSLKRLDDKIIDSVNKGSYKCKSLTAESSTHLAPLSCPDQKNEGSQNCKLLDAVSSTDLAPLSCLDQKLEEENKLLGPVLSTDLAPPSCLPDQKLEEENEIETEVFFRDETENLLNTGEPDDNLNTGEPLDNLNPGELDDNLNLDPSLAETTPNDHESILEMLQRQVLQNHSINVQDSDKNSPVRDRASPPEDDSMMPPLSPKTKKSRRQTDKQSPLWGYLAEVGNRKRKI